MEKTYLQIVFVDSMGKRKSFNIPNPRTDLTGTEIQSAMDVIITKNVFEQELVSKHSAVVITTTREDVYN